MINARGLKPALAALSLLAPTTALAEWTGAYAGVSFEQLTKGTLSIDELTDDEFDAIADNAISAFGGYQLQQGDFVFGAELAVGQANNLAIANADVFGGLPSIDSRVVDLKARAGYDLGPAMVYGFAGFTQATILDDDLTDLLDEDTSTGANYGFGLDYRVTEQFTVGGEFIVRDLALGTEVFGEEVEFDTNTQSVALRAAFNF